MIALYLLAATMTLLGVAVLVGIVILAMNEPESQRPVKEKPRQ